MALFVGAVLRVASTEFAKDNQCWTRSAISGKFLFSFPLYT
jgi:hypothetical protein